MVNVPQNNPIIKNTLLLLLGVFLLLLFLNYTLTSYFFSSIEQGQHLVNVAGKNRTLSQTILIDAQKISEGNENLKVLLREHITEHAQILRALRDGGTITVDKQEVDIKKNTDQDIAPVIRRVENLWRSYQDSASIIVAEPIKITVRTETKISLETDLSQLDAEEKQIANPRILRALEYLRSKSNEMLTLNEQLLREYLIILDKNRQNANLLIVVLTLLNIGFIVSAFLVIRSIILRPLSLIAYAAEKIAEGSSNQTIEYQFDNEVGSVVKAINQMVGSLDSATNFIQDIGSGNLQAQYKGIEQTSDFKQESLAGALLDMRERMINVAQSEKNREWSNTGLTKFVEILRQNNDNLEQLSYNILTELIHYVEAAQGGLYILNEENLEEPFAELVAAYAFGKQKFIQQKIYANDGVIGQVLIDKDSIYLDDIPENYADISSGLGGAKPKSVLIIPLKLNEKLIGLIELTSFSSFEEYKIEFIERLANNIASTISNVKVNERTRLLLEDQQRITMQMRVQEDDMKQNMVKLQNTQEEMRKNEDMLRAQSFAISSTLVSAEYDMEGRLLNANNLFLDKLKYKLSDIKGKHHRTFLDTQSSYGEEYLKFWDALRAGKTQSGEYKRITKEGAEIWLRATYVPTPDRDDNLYKVICLAFDITEEKLQVIDYQSQVEALRRSSLVVEFDLRGYILEANALFLEQFGYEKAELINQHYNIFFHLNESDDDGYKTLWRQLRGGKYESGEYEFLSKSDSKIWISGSFNPIFDLNGNTVKVMMLADDISKKKEADVQFAEIQSRIKSQQENLTTLINNTDERILSIDKYYYVTILNDNVKNVFKQMGREVEIGANILDTFPERTYSRLKEPYDKALSGEKVRIEEIYNSSKGEEISLLVTYNPIFDDSDNVQGVTVFAKDITEIKKNQEQLIHIQKEMEEKEADLRALINNLDDCVFAIDTEYKLVVFNDAFSNLLQTKKSNTPQIKDEIEYIFTANEWVGWKSMFDRSLGGEKFRVNVSLFDDYYELSSNSIINKDNKVIGVALDLEKIELL